MMWMWLLIALFFVYNFVSGILDMTQDMPIFATLRFFIAGFQLYVMIDLFSDAFNKSIAQAVSDGVLR